MSHIGLSIQDLGDCDTAILTGDPHRVAFLAKCLDKNAKHLKNSREYHSYRVKVNNKSILVISTGIGGPSTSICIEELAMLGIERFIRVGTTGAIQHKIKLGDLIISTASVRLDGASFHYAPSRYPAVSSFPLTMELYNSATSLNFTTHLGITASTDTFYPGQERYDNYTGYVRNKYRGSMEEWKKLNVLNYEMESATLFTVCSVLGLEAACICGVLVQRAVTEQLAGNTESIMTNIMDVVRKTLK